MLPGGFVGVDIFFVLSGFLVTRLILDELEQGRFSFAEFYSRRARRLFPGLVLVLLATLAVSPSFMTGEDYMQTAKQAAAAAVFLANFLAWKQAGYFDGEAAFRPLIHLWSLGIEEQFYLIFPVVLWFAWAKCRRAIGGLLALAFTLSFARCVTMTLVDDTAAFYLPHTRFWEFLVGAILAWGQSTKRDLQDRTRHLRSLAGAGAIGYSVMCISAADSFPGGVAMVPVAGAYLLLSAGPLGWANRFLLTNGVLRWLGKISYSVYLWHWPLLVLARYYVQGEPEPALAFGLAFASVILGWGSTETLERRFRYGLWAQHRGAAPGLAAALVVVAAAALPVAQVVNSGTPPVLAKLYRYPVPEGDPWREGKGCFVNANKVADFGPDCVPRRTDGRPMAVLWGDSHAAHLWPGLHAVAARQWLLAQVTASQCPAIADAADGRNPTCDAMRERALAAIREQRPEIVFMASRWSMYQPRDDMVASVSTTVGALKAMGVRRVVVVGPVPHWSPSLAKALARDMRSFKRDQPPLYPTGGLQPAEFKLDPILREAASKGGAEYVSPMTLLCTPQRQCRAWVDEQRKDTLMAFDNAHLTVEGSEFLAKRMLEQIQGHAAREP